jgi:WD40 repeat protein
MKNLPHGRMLWTLSLLCCGALACTLTITIRADWENPTAGIARPYSEKRLPAAGTEIPTPTPRPTETPRPVETPTASPTPESASDCTHPFWSESVPDGARARLEHFIVFDLAVSPDGRYFAAAGLEGDWGSCAVIVALYRTDDLVEAWTYYAGGDMIEEIEFSPDGSRLAAAVHSGSVRLIDTATGKPAGSWENNLDEYSSDVSWSPDGAFLAVGVSNASAVLWDAGNGTPNRTLGGNPAHTPESHSEPCYLDWSPDGTRIAVGTDRGRIHIFDPLSGRSLLSFSSGVFPGNADQIDWTGYLTALAWSPDGKTLAAGSQTEVDLWNPQSGEIRRTLRGHASTVTALAWSADGRRLASGDGYYNDDGTVIVWDADAGTIVRKLQGHKGFFVTAVAWMMDGQTVLSGSIDGSLILWNAG